MNIGGNLGNIVSGIFGGGRSKPEAIEAENADAAITDSTNTGAATSGGGGWFTKPAENADADRTVDADGMLKDGTLENVTESLQNLTDKMGGVMEGLSDNLKNMTDKIKEGGLDPVDAAKTNMEMQQGFSQMNQMTQGLSDVLKGQQGAAAGIVNNIRSNGSVNPEAAVSEADVPEATRGPLGKMSDGLSRMFGDAENVDLKDAAKVLTENTSTVLRELGEKSANGTMTDSDTKLAEAIENYTPAVLMGSLDRGDVKTLDLSDIKDISPTGLYKGILAAGARAHVENELPFPEKELEAVKAHEMHHQVQYETNKVQDTSAEEDASLGL